MGRICMFPSSYTIIIQCGKVTKTNTRVEEVVTPSVGAENAGHRQYDSWRKNKYVE